MEYTRKEETTVPVTLTLETCTHSHTSNIISHSTNYSLMQWMKVISL